MAPEDEREPPIAEAEEDALSDVPAEEPIGSDNDNEDDQVQPVEEPLQPARVAQHERRVTKKKILRTGDQEAPKAVIPRRPTMEQELYLEEQRELAALRAMMGRDERHQLGGSAGSSSRAGHSTDRPGGFARADPHGRWNERGGRSVPGRWNSSPFKTVPYSLRGLQPLAGLSRNEPWASDIVDTCSRLELAPSTAYATAGLSRLDDGMYDDVAMLRRRRVAEDVAASTATSRPAWDPTPWRYCPPQLVRTHRTRNISNALAPTHALCFC